MIAFPLGHNSWSYQLLEIQKACLIKQFAALIERLDFPASYQTKGACSQKAWIENKAVKKIGTMSVVNMKGVRRRNQKSRSR